jgi:hypothetical protein
MQADLGAPKKPEFRNSVEIQKSNIVLDGAGHKIDCSVDNHMNVGLRLFYVNNVFVKNLEVTTVFGNTIYLHFCSNCLSQE